MPSSLFLGVWSWNKEQLTFLIRRPLPSLLWRVTKTEDADWSLLKPSILGTIMEHFVSNHPLFFGDKAKADTTYDGDPVVAEIKEIIDTRVRPAVAMDGGDITFEKFEEGVVYLRLQGACSGCPSSSVTLKSGIENMLKHYVPEVTEVRAIDTEEG
jgi:Fe-S cluster biogenesis protein NfuA